MRKVTITFNGTLEFRVPEVKSAFENETTAKAIERVLEKDMQLTDPRSIATVVVSDISVAPEGK